MADLSIGSQFGKWTVLGPREGPNYYPCRCECGTEKIVNGANLRSGLSKSCGGVGCRKASHYKHGASKTRLYRNWFSMIERCRYFCNRAFGDCGLRGITVCPEWETDFAAFRDWALANGYRPDLQIDRIDNNGPYSPENCRWVMQQQNARNKRNNLQITAFGETKILAEWAEDPRCAVKRATLGYRIRTGWESERALTEPENESVLRRFSAFGETKYLREWSRDPRCVVSYKTLHGRVTDGCSIEVALTTPEITRAMQEEQGKTNSRMIEAFGETKSIEAWARDSRCRPKAASLWHRLFKMNLPPEVAITRPVRGKTIT